jgi:predicted nicotinamide N-methyase
MQLGAGLGLCGILASHLQPSKVILTDGDTNALKYLRANVKRNLPLVGDVLTTGATSSSRTTVMVRQLIWGETISFMSGDQDAFDTVLGSDIIYVEEILEPLWRTISRLLAPDGAFLLAFARRNVPIDRVFEVADANGFVWVVDDSKSEGVVVFRRSKGR